MTAAVSHGRARQLIALAALLGALAIGVYQSHSGLRTVADDFRARYAAAEVAADGASPYDASELVPRELELGSRAPVPVYDPPPLLAGIWLLSLLPLEAAALALNAASFAVVGLLGWWIARDRGPGLLAVAVIGVLVASPTRFALSLGAPDLVVLGVVLLLAHHQPAIGILKPQTGATLTAGAFLTGPRTLAPRRLVLALVGAAVVLGVPAVVVPGASWVAWVRALGDRPRSVDELFVVHVALTILGVGVLAWGLLRARRAGRPVDLVALGGASCSLVSLLASWNGYWHLAHVLPLGAVLLAARSPDRPLRPWQAGLLLVAAAAAMGDAYTPNSAYGTFQIWVPVAAVAAVTVALVALREIPAWAAAAIVVLNLVITAAPLEVHDRTIVPVAVGIALTYLVFELWPDPIPERPRRAWTARRPSAQEVS